MKTKTLLISMLMPLGFYCFGQTNYSAGTGAGNAGSSNTSVGVSAGDVVTGSENSFFGYYAGKNATSSFQNAFFGHRSGFSNTTGGANFFGGAYSGENNTTGQFNVFIGHQSGNVNSIGASNSYLGYQSGRASTGSSNVYLGSGACGNCTTGSYNVAIGRAAGGFANTGANNVFIGYQAGYNGTFGTAGSNNIFLGYQAGYNESGSNRLYIENSDSSTPLIYGDFATDKVGINSLPNTTHTLTVGGTIHATGIYINGQSLSDAGFEFWTKAGNNVWNNTGNVGIGTALTQNPHNYKLAVNGKLGAHEVQIENNSLTWPDFVFNDSYKLMSLPELEVFIKTNKHLPEIPTQKDVKENGILVSELNAKLLQKIEELTLHLIELKKEVEALKKGAN